MRVTRDTCYVQCTYRLLSSPVAPAAFQPHLTDSLAGWLAGWLGAKGSQELEASRPEWKRLGKGIRVRRAGEQGAFCVRLSAEHTSGKPASEGAQGLG